MEGNLMTPLKAFLEQAHSFVSQRAKGMDHYWLDIRATQGSDEWNMPRWHTDGNFFHRPNEGQWKLATCLLGPGTLFLVDGDEGRKAEEQQRMIMFETMEKQIFVDKVEERNFEMQKAREVRKILADMFVEWEIAQPSIGEMAFFRGGSVKAAVHSEPRSVGDRIFVSVLPGTEAELKDLAKSWGKSWGDHGA